MCVQPLCFSHLPGNDDKHDGDDDLGADDADGDDVDNDEHYQLRRSEFMLSGKAESDPNVCSSLLFHVVPVDDVDVDVET